jgi:hypothetical protein
MLLVLCYINPSMIFIVELISGKTERYKAGLIANSSTLLKILDSLIVRNESLG